MLTYAKDETAEWCRSIRAKSAISPSGGHHSRVQSLTGKMLELCPGQERVQSMTKLMEQRLGLVGAHQAAV